MGDEKVLMSVEELAIAVLDGKDGDFLRFMFFRLGLEKGNLLSDYNANSQRIAQQIFEKDSRKFSHFVLLDKLGITGSRLVKLYEKCCEEDFDELLKVLMILESNVLPKETIDRVIDSGNPFLVTSEENIYNNRKQLSKMSIKEMAIELLNDTKKANYYEGILNKMSVDDLEEERQGILDYRKKQMLCYRKLDIIDIMSKDRNGFKHLIVLDKLNIRGSQLETLYKKCCNKNVNRFAITIEMFCTDTFSEDEIHNNLSQKDPIPFIYKDLDERLNLKGSKDTRDLNFDHIDWEDYCAEQKAEFVKRQPSTRGKK